MAKDRYIRNVQRDRVRAQGDANFDNGAAAMRITWQQKNSEHLALVREALACPNLFQETRLLLLGWEAMLLKNTANNLTSGRIALLRRIQIVAKMDATMPDRPPVKPKPRNFARNPNFEKKRAAWLEDPTLLPKKPPSK